MQKLKQTVVPVLVSMMTVVMMSPIALAAEEDHNGGAGTGNVGGGGFTSGGMGSILSAVDTVVSLMGKVWDVMTSNPLLCVFLAVSLLVVGIRLFKRIKAAAR